MTVFPYSILAGMTESMKPHGQVTLEGIRPRTYRTSTHVIYETKTVQTVARRAYGFHSAEALQSMIFFCCGDIELHPPLPK